MVQTLDGKDSFYNTYSDVEGLNEESILQMGRYSPFFP